MANLRIAELDFDTIKTNLKEFLKNYTADDGAPYFTDFDFEGSGLSILLDLLSYNTHYNAYLASMVINDMFLDSAVKRSSAVSIAKHLGYTPVSARGARAMLTFDVSAPTNSPNFLTLEKYTPFTTTIDNATLTFVNLKSVTIQPKAGTYTFTDVELVEGIPIQYTYTVDVPGPAEKYIIPNDDIDTSTIQVIVQNSFTDTTQSIYTLAEDTLDVTDTSKVFFLEETAIGRYQIYFGDGVVGKKLTRNNLVIINYLITSGTAGNVAGTIAQSFTCATTIGGGSVLGAVTATTNSRGGKSKESIESIKFRAPKFSASQNRAVTDADYKALIEKDFPLVESIAVWGGENNDPPKYGKVIISLKPYDGYVVNQDTRNNISKVILQSKQVLGIAPEFIDPEYFYVNLSINVKYDSAKSTLSATEINNFVITEVNNYFYNNLQQFDKDFVFSKLSKNIDSIDDNIIGNLMTVKLQRRIEPVANSNNNYISDNVITFKNGLKPGTLTSTNFIVSYQGISKNATLNDFPDDTFPNNLGKGTIKLMDADTGVVLNDNYGSIDYGTGILTIYNLQYTGYVSDLIDIRINAEVQDSYLDINVSRNQILLLDDSTLNSNGNRVPGLTVNVIAV
jgi:hypothetical protein